MIISLNKFRAQNQQRLFRQSIRNLLSGFNAILLIGLYDENIGKEVAIEVPPETQLNREGLVCLELVKAQL